MKIVEKAAVLGSGSWGTALAQIVAAHAERVSIWGRDRDAAAAINNTRQNPRYLPGLPLDCKISATTDIGQALKDAGAVVICLPTTALEPVLAAAAGLFPREVPVISTSKGICPETLRFPSRIIKETLGRRNPSGVFVLSGPSFAKETANKLPTAVTFAGESMAEAERWGHLFFKPYFRTYPSTDMAGVETAGALKNVIALAAGAADGLNLGSNARSALMTRGLAEITKMGRHFGADPMTFLGLSGMGDLILTCTGGLSRNRTLGRLLAEGKTLEQGLAALGQTAEGVSTAKSVRRIMTENNLDLPICAQVYEVLFQGKAPQEAIMDLMNRPMHPEHQ